MVNGLNGQYTVSNTGLNINQENIHGTIEKSKQAVNDHIESNSAVQVISNNVGQENSMYQKVLLLPLLSVIDNFIDNLIGGEQKTSLLKKIANVGDSISHKLHLDNVISEGRFTSISNFLKNNRFTKYFTNDFKATPKLSMVKSMVSETMENGYEQRLDGLAQKLLKTLKSLAAEDNGLKSSAVFKDVVKNAALSDDTLKLINDLSVEGSTFSNQQIFNAVNDLVEKGVKIKDSAKISQLLNKTAAAGSKMGETLLGKTLSKGFLKIKDTLSFNGGLLGLFFTAGALYDAVKAAKEAPKGEKKSTFMHVLSEQYIGIILFNPCINLLYKIGGNKYRGIDKAGRDAIANLVKTTNADKTLTKEAYKVAKLRQKLLLKGVAPEKVEELAGKGIKEAKNLGKSALKEAKNLAKSLKGKDAKLKLWERPLKALGRLLDAGLDTIKSPTKLGRIGNKLKGFLCGAGRFLVIMMVIQPIIQKPITKLCHKIFGEPKTYLAKQKQQNEASKNEEVQKPVNGETNLLKIIEDKNKQPDILKQPEEQTDIPQQKKEQTVPSGDLTPSSTLSPNATTSIYNNFIPSTPADAPKTNAQNQGEEEPVAAFNLFDKKGKNDKRYIPDINVDNSYVDKREKELEKEVEKILKSTDSVLKDAKKALN